MNKLTISILANFVANDLSESLEYWLAELGLIGVSPVMEPYPELPIRFHYWADPEDNSELIDVRFWGIGHIPILLALPISPLFFGLHVHLSIICSGRDGKSNE